MSSPTKKSKPNTTRASGPFNDLAVLQPSRNVGAEDKASAALESTVENLRTERKQERFFWMMAVISLVVVIVGMSSPWYVFATALLFGLLILIAAAKWLEVPFVVTHLERWFEQASRTKDNGGTE